MADKTTPEPETTTEIPPEPEMEAPPVTTPEPETTLPKTGMARDPLGLNRPAEVPAEHADFIDPAPGYSNDQVAHMQEYYGLADSTASEADA